MSSQSLLGTWNLLSWEIRSSEGTATYPIGENPRGIIIYDDVGPYGAPTHADGSSSLRLG